MSLVVGAIVVVGVVGLFVVSRVLTDRYVWSQWMWWVPGGWFVLVGWGMLVGSVLMRRFGKKRGRNRWQRYLLWGVVVGCVGMIFHVVFVEWRWGNVIGKGGIHWARAVDDGGVRVMHWNLAAGEIDVERAVAWIGESDVDVVLIANPRFDGQRQELVAGLERIVGDEGVVMRVPRGVVMSRFDVVRSSMVYFSADDTRDAPENTMRTTGGFGWMSLLRFDGGGERGLFEVWFVDLPSEPSAHRMELIGRVVGLLEERVGGAEPDLKPALIIGDFNTVRGSASLGLFDVFAGGEDGDGFVDAFEERGSGVGGSWRPTGLGGLKGWVAGRSSWGIDLSLVGNGWVVEGYGLLMPDGGVWGEGVSHRAQMVDIGR